MAIAARRVVLFDRAREALGGQALADALGVTRRSVNHKIAVDRGLSDADLRLAAVAIEARRDALADLADDIRALVA